MLKLLIFNAVKPLPEHFIKEAQEGLNLGKLNHFLWVYDRYDARAYFSNKTSLKDAEKKLSEMLVTEQGRERVKQILDRIILNEKKYFDGLAEYRKDIIKQASEYKRQIDENMRVNCRPGPNRKEQIMNLQDKFEFQEGTSLPKGARMPGVKLGDNQTFNTASLPVRE